jgi:1-deoxy-D-xylulose-5-phosphate reductoisomerase
VREYGGELIPVDSEHSSIFRCLQSARSDEVERIVLTASGGPLRDLPAEATATAAVSEVLSHPTWSMGDKVTVDSATLVNKAMEVVEARWLFDLPYDRIDVVLHRESVVHGFVTLSDGTLLAHLAAPDMRVPIQYAMFYPERAPSSSGDCPPEQLGTLHFTAVDYERYPCFGLVLEAARRGGTGPAIAATADEVAVAAFTEGRIRFGDIADVIEETVSAVAPSEAPDVGSILAAGELATAFAGRVIDRLKIKES